MTFIISYYNPSSMNGASHRLYALYNHMKNHGYEVKFVTYGEFPTSEDVISVTYWKRLNIIIFMKCVIFRMLNKIGNPIKDWQYYTNIFRLVKEHQPKNIILSYPTIDNLFLANVLSKNKNINVVFDYRDGITSFPLEDYNFLQRLIYKKIELKIARRDNVKITGVNKFIVPDEVENLFTEITNFRQIQTQRVRLILTDKSSIKFVHFGQISNSYKRKAAYFYSAIDEMCKNYSNINFVIDFYGRLSDEEKNELLKLRNKNLVISLLEPVSVDDLRKNYDVALLLGVPGHEGYVSSKFFSYLQLNLPIFAAADGNLVASYIKDYNIGLVGRFAPQFLNECIRLSDNKEFYTKDLRIFDEASQCEKFAQLLN